MGPDPQTLPRTSRPSPAAPRSVDAIQGLTSVACSGRADFDGVRASTPFLHHQAVVDALATRHADADQRSQVRVPLLHGVGVHQPQGGVLGRVEHLQKQDLFVALHVTVSSV